MFFPFEYIKGMEDIKKRIANIEDAICKLGEGSEAPISNMHNRLSAMHTTLSAMQAEKDVLLQRGTAPLTPLALASSSTSDSTRADRSGINGLGAHLASLSREHGGGATLRDYGFDCSCPVSIRDDIALRLDLPGDSYWAAWEIAEIIASRGRKFALMIWDDYISNVKNTCHVYLPDGEWLAPKIPKYRQYILDTEEDIDGVRVKLAFTIVSSSWFINREKY